MFLKIKPCQRGNVGSSPVRHPDFGLCRLYHIETDLHAEIITTDLNLRFSRRAAYDPRDLLNRHFLRCDAGVFSSSTNGGSAE